MCEQCETEGEQRNAERGIRPYDRLHDGPRCLALAIAAGPEQRRPASRFEKRMLLMVGIGDADINSKFYTTSANPENSNRIRMARRNVVSCTLRNAKMPSET